MSDVLVTGGAGFLGQHFVRWHLAQGDNVVVVDHRPEDEWPRWPGKSLMGRGGVQNVVADAGDYFAGDTFLFDIAYHFAAPVGGRVKIEGDPFFNADSLRLDQAFFRWAIKRAGISIYPSSSAVYPTALQIGDGHQLQEGMFSPANPTWFAPDELYGFTKFVGEQLAWRAAEHYGAHVLCIRPFSGYGEGQSLDYPIPAICSRAVRGEDPLVVWGSGYQRRDFIHVDDVVGATIARLNAGVHGYEAMNICSGWVTSFLDVAKAAARAMGYKPTISTDETKPVGVQSRFGDPQRMQRYYGEPRVSLKQGLLRVMEALDGVPQTA